MICPMRICSNGWMLFFLNPHESIARKISFHAQDLTRALFDFSQAGKKEFHPILRNILYKLVSMQIERRFLNPQEVGEITENPLELKAVGTVDDFALVMTKKGDYISKVLRVRVGDCPIFTSKVETIDSLNLDRAERFFQEHLKDTVDDYQLCYRSGDEKEMVNFIRRTRNR